MEAARLPYIKLAEQVLAPLLCFLTVEAAHLPYMEPAEQVLAPLQFLTAGAVLQAPQRLALRRVELPLYLQRQEVAGVL